jgi:hypothetical protein
MPTTSKSKKTICAQQNTQSPESLAESTESLTQMTSYFPTNNDSKLFDFVTEIGNITKSPKSLQNKKKAITTQLTNNSCAQPENTKRKSHLAVESPGKKKRGNWN